MGRIEMKKVALAVLALAALPAFALETHTVDRAHSTVGFSIRHLVGRVSGTFEDYTMALTIDRANPAASSVEFRIKAASIETRNAKRDEHLRTPDFFDVAKFPEIVFKSTKVVPKGQDRFDVTGDFTMHGVTKSLTLPVVYAGTMKDPRGSEKSGFEIETILNRKDFGLVWNAALDTGGFVLGDEVTIRISLETQKEAPPVAK
jgi:polyisoprenoid-binding protein YceI